VSLSGGFSRKQATFSRNQTYRLSAGSRLELPADHCGDFMEVFLPDRRIGIDRVDHASGHILDQAIGR
jgi:hypothetical protein